MLHQEVLAVDHHVWRDGGAHHHVVMGRHPQGEGVDLRRILRERRRGEIGQCHRGAAGGEREGGGGAAPEENCSREGKLVWCALGWKSSSERRLLVMKGADHRASQSCCGRGARASMSTCPSAPPPATSAPFTKSSRPPSRWKAFSPGSRRSGPWSRPRPPSPPSSGAGGHPGCFRPPPWRGWP